MSVEDGDGRKLGSGDDDDEEEGKEIGTVVDSVAVVPNSGNEPIDSMGPAPLKDLKIVRIEEEKKVGNEWIRTS